jgi:hypothetical protein
VEESVRLLLKKQHPVKRQPHSATILKKWRGEESPSVLRRRGCQTFNVGDFCRLHKSYMTRSISHTGIIVAAKQRYSVGEQVKALANLIATRSAEDIKNKLVFLGDYLE